MVKAELIKALANVPDDMPLGMIVLHDSGPRFRRFDGATQMNAQPFSFVAIQVAPSVPVVIDGIAAELT